jgi:hypothetical protein
MSTNIKYVIRRTWVALALTALVITAMWSLTTPAYSCRNVVHIVGEGESLWSIAELHCSGDIREVVYNLSQKYGMTVHPGQQIEID